MGAGRRTETNNCNAGYFPAGGGGNRVPPQLNLPAKKLGAVILGCSNDTMEECLAGLLFGLPISHRAIVESIKRGLTLFLFNYTQRRMYGIFEAISDGGLYINPYAWTSESNSRTPYPAQVKVKVFKKCNSLPEHVFKEAIADNYHSGSHFYFELTIKQTEDIKCLFNNCTPGAISSSPVSKSAVTSVTAPTPALPSITGGQTAWQTSTTGRVQVWKKASGSCVAGSEENLHELQKAPAIPSPSKGTPLGELRDTDLVKVKLHGANGISALLSGNLPKEDGKSERETSVLEKLMRLRVQKEQPLSLVSVSQVAETPIGGPEEVPETLEWERLARERCFQEQAVLKEEREKMELSLNCLDAAVSTTVKANLELYASALAQMRQDAMEMRRALGEAKMHSTNIAALERTLVTVSGDVQDLKFGLKDLQNEVREIKRVPAASESEIQSLKQDVLGLKREIASLSRTRIREVEEATRCDLIPDLKLTQKPLPEVYVMGGLGNLLSGIESVVVWSPGTDRLRPAAPMKAPRSCTGSCVLDGQIYVCGGGNGNWWYETVERYDKRSNTWTECASMKNQRGSLAAVSVGDRIFAVGGGNCLMQFSEVESYDPHLGMWMPCTSMLEKRFSVAATELDGVLYAMGGYDGEHYLMSVERFDPREALWTRVPSMSARRGSLSAAVLNGKIYVIGGFNGVSFLDVVEVFDPRAAKWEPAPIMCCPRAYGATAVVGDVLYYMGGLADGASDLPDSSPVQCFTEQSGWQGIQPLPIGARSCFAAVVL